MKRLLTLGLIVAATCMGSPQLAAASTPSHDSTVAIAAGPLSAYPAYAAMSVHPLATVAPAFARPLAQAAPTVRAAQSNHRAPLAPDTAPFDMLVPLGGLLLIGAVKTTVADKNTPFATDTVRAQLNAIIADYYYLKLNGLISTTVATLPVCDMATTKSKCKTTNATVIKNSGVANALGATDNAWTLTGGVLAVSSFRRYLLLADSADAFTVQASTDASTAAGCTWTNRPADGLAIVGILTVGTDATHTFTPATTLLDATGITKAFIDDIDASVILAAQVTP